MTATAPLISFGLYALAIGQDAIPSCPDQQSFSNLQDLLAGNVATKPYATFEPNFWLLDGNYKFRPDVDSLTHVGLMSLSMSGSDGTFATAPVLTVNFTRVHTTDGLTFKFAQQSGDWPAAMTIAFYDASDVLIRTDNYTPTSALLSTVQEVVDFKKIIITFSSTNKPYRYLRVSSLSFGKLTYFQGTDIRTANITEQVQPLCTELPVGILDLELYTNDPSFSIVDPTGDYAQLESRQPLDVYELVSGEQVYLGQFFLDTWENPTETEVVFHCVDRIGILDKTPYMGGIWITAVDLEDLIDEIMSAIHVPYELESALVGTQVSGWIPVTSYRSALQQIAFACGAYVTCSRSGVVRILQTRLASQETTFDVSVPIGTICQAGQNLSLKPLVTGVEVTAHTYVENTTSSTLYNGTLQVGVYKIIFSKPAHTLSKTGTATATITSSGANYAIITVTVAGTVILSGQGYTDTQRVVGVYNETLDPSVTLNVIQVAEATLVNPTNVSGIVQRAYDYYQQRHLQKARVYLPAMIPGSTVSISSLFNRSVGGVVEKMQTDLCGGYVSNLEITGVILP